ncbi:MAG: hypothetical protein ACW99G_23150 [Candidatus Thorarchaeota archaeon]
MKLKSHTKDQLMEVVPWKWSDDHVVRSYESPEHAEKDKQQRKSRSALYSQNFMLIEWDDLEE